WSSDVCSSDLRSVALACGPSVRASCIRFFTRRRRPTRRSTRTRSRSSRTQRGSPGGPLTRTFTSFRSLWYTPAACSRRNRSPSARARARRPARRRPASGSPRIACQHRLAVSAPGTSRVTKKLFLRTPARRTPGASQARSPPRMRDGRGSPLTRHLSEERLHALEVRVPRQPLGQPSRRVAEGGALGPERPGERGAERVQVLGIVDDEGR